MYEMVGTRRADLREFLRAFGIYKIQNSGRIVETQNGTRNPRRAAQNGHDAFGNFAASRFIELRCRDCAENFFT